jgi:putative DNA primase/helicase
MNLAPEHLTDLQRSGLSDDTIVIMGVSSLRPADIDKLSSGGLTGVESVLKIPYFGVNGFCRYKLYPPLKKKDGHSLKYFQPKDSGCHLYVLPSVADKLGDISVPLLIVEGEKKTAAAVQHGLHGIGIGGIWNWKDKDSWKGIDELQRIAFADRDTGLVFDSDTWTRDDLQQAIYALGKYLEFRGAKVSVYLIPQPTKEKVGLDDYLLNHNVDDFNQLKKLTLKHPTLAQHKEWYAKWKAEKDGDGVNDLQGKPLFLREIEPHGEPVDGVELLIEICRAIRRYVVAENADIVAMALWCIAAHGIDAFAISPFLNLSSPEKGCGKSTTLTVLSYLLPRPLLSASVSPASIFRAIELYKPTFLIDEADTFQNLNEELRGLLNASHLRASSQVIRTVGDEHEPRTFSTWCPKAISLIGRLPDTLNDRSIVIEMKRRKKDEQCERFSAIEAHPDLEFFAKKIARWVKDRFESIRQARPEAEGIDLRLYDNWMPLLAVADIAGGQWPKWVRIAAGWFVAKAADSPSIKVELLTDMVAIMAGADRMFSEDIIKALGDMADRPWAAFGRRGKPISQIQVARMMSGFGIKSQQMRIGDRNAKGYNENEIVSAQSRYAPPGEAKQTKQENKDKDISELEAIFVSDRNETEKESETKQTGNGSDWPDGAQHEAENGEKKEPDDAKDKPRSCEHCSGDHIPEWRRGGKIIERTWSDGRKEWACDYCGRAV